MVIGEGEGREGEVEVMWLTRMQLTGTEFAKAKEDTAAIMRAKQAAGMY